MLLAHLNRGLAMTISSLPPLPPRHAAHGAARARLQAHAASLLARWYATHCARPLYSHRLGAFDLARSGLARELLKNLRR
jgi:hypothetical protein